MPGLIRSFSILIIDPNLSIQCIITLGTVTHAHEPSLQRINWQNYFLFSHCYSYRKDFHKDFVTKLPVSTNSRYTSSPHILVITKSSTKERHFVPCQAIAASSLARKFILLIIPTLGLLSFILSDCDLQFTTRFPSALCPQLNIIVKFSMSYHSISMVILNVCQHDLVRQNT